MTAQTQDIATIIRKLGGDPVEDMPFWEGARDGRFLLHTCKTCNRAYWPASRCIDHGGAAMEWNESKGDGVLYTYTVLHKAYTSSMKGKVPYVVGVIQLDEGPFIHSNVLGCEPESVHVGMKLRVQLERHESGLTVPMLYPA